MFEHHFGLRENPFPAGHQLKFVYPSREHMEARAHLRYGIENREPFLLITGEVGTGKTTSLYDALNEWGDRVAVFLECSSWVKVMLGFSRKTFRNGSRSNPWPPVMRRTLVLASAADI